MSAISTWSTTAASNNSAAPDGFPEGMAPSGVNNAAREVMAAVRSYYDAPEWRDFGHTVAYVSGTQFSTAAGDGDTTGVYVVNRRVRAVGSATTTIYGRVTASSGNPTTVTVVWDSGALQSEALTISVGPTPTGLLVDATAVKRSAWNVLATQGDLAYNDGTDNVAALALGTAGQLLTSDGTDPAWASAVTHSGWVNMPSATDYEFTGIPSWATNIVVQCEDLSGDGTAYPLIQLVTAGGDIETGYLSRTNHEANSNVAQATNGYLMYLTVAATITKGVWHLTRADNSSDHDWFLWGFAQQSDQNNVAYLCYGNCGAGAAVDGINLTWTNGTDSFDGGKASVMYW